MGDDTFTDKVGKQWQMINQSKRSNPMKGEN
jgi:hypothetical protein